MHTCTHTENVFNKCCHLAAHRATAVGQLLTQIMHTRAHKNTLTRCAFYLKPKIRALARTQCNYLPSEKIARAVFNAIVQSEDARSRMHRVITRYAVRETHTRADDARAMRYLGRTRTLPNTEWRTTLPTSILSSSALVGRDASTSVCVCW